jgi:hypothetical protein
VVNADGLNEVLPVMEQVAYSVFVALAVNEFPEGLTCRFGYSILSANGLKVEWLVMVNLGNSTFNANGMKVEWLVMVNLGNSTFNAMGMKVVLLVACQVGLSVVFAVATKVVAVAGWKNEETRLVP